MNDNPQPNGRDPAGRADPDPKLSREAIDATREVIRTHLRRTPVLTVPGRSLDLPATSVTLKLELLQHTGSFKCRGAFANLLERPIPPAGVVAASGGNHGAAVAYAAMKLGVPARIFVPCISSPAKIRRIEAYGATLVVGGADYAEALAASERWLEGSGALAVHAFDQPETIRGQGTLASELSEQAAGLDTLLVAVGGGGLIAGIAAWYAGTVKVVGVEPAAAPTLRRALDAGRPVEAEAGGVAADSLAPRQVGAHVFPVATRFVHDVVLVEDQAIVGARRRLWDEFRLLAEPGGATAFAALDAGAYRPRPAERVGVVVSGGNTASLDFG